MLASPRLAAHGDETCSSSSRARPPRWRLGRVRELAHADLGRPAGHPDASAGRALAAPAQMIPRGPSRRPGPETGRRASPGRSPEFFDIRNWVIDKGFALCRHRRAGGGQGYAWRHRLRQALRPGMDPVGKTVRIRAVSFLIVGLLQRKGQSPMGTDYDDGAFIPVSTFQNQIQGGLQEVHRRHHRRERRFRRGHRPCPDRDHVAPPRPPPPRGGDEDDFNIRNLTEMANASSRARRRSPRSRGRSRSCRSSWAHRIMKSCWELTSARAEIGVRQRWGAKPWARARAVSRRGCDASMIGRPWGSLLARSSRRLVRPRLAGLHPARRHDLLSSGFRRLVGVLWSYPARKAHGSIHRALALRVTWSPRVRRRARRMSAVVAQDGEDPFSRSAGANAPVGHGPIPVASPGEPPTAEGKR